MSQFEVSSLLLAAASVGLLLWQVRIAIRALNADHERRKKQSTIEFLMGQVRPLWTQGRKVLDERWGEDALTERALKEIQEDRAARDAVETLLGHLEYMSVGINTGIYDQDILYRASGTYLIRLFHRLRPFVKLAQKDLPSKYIEFENLIRDFEEKKRLRPPAEGDLKPI